MANLSDVLEFRTVVRGPNLSNQINVRHYRLNGIGGSGLTDQQIADQYSTAFAAQIKGMINTSSTYVGLFYRTVSPLVGVQLSSTTGAGVGTRGVTPAVNQVAGILTFRAATAPPRIRGRFYCPAGIQSDAGATGDPSATYITALQAFGNALYAADLTLTVGANNVSLRPVIFHRKAPAANYQITTVLARTYFATQRRRSSVHGSDRSLF